MLLSLKGTKEEHNGFNPKDSELRTDEVKLKETPIEGFDEQITRQLLYVADFVSFMMSHILAIRVPISKGWSDGERSSNSSKFEFGRQVRVVV
ncbi:hypothetical protein NPX13_g5136 [Xylaria arbuscula]|uniref:Uncharacterized protein n=1 Tax=Xylaria arbuscula TaxID=114810 RepID=A0A9W8TLK3_9PEZI|nr:hypothetical protein NPX13_g5136 [Xylaria arbuscula]